MRGLLRRLSALCLCGFLVLAALPARAVSFPDVKPGSWYEKDVLEMADAGLLTGLPDGTFAPEKTISWAEFVTIAARCAGLSPIQGQTSHWAAGTLEAARLAGWYDWDELPPTGEGFDKPISRQLAVKVLMRALLPHVGYDFNVESAKIKDFSALNGRYYEAVLSAYAAGVAQGDGEGSFRPLDSLSRAESCALIQRARAKAGSQTPASPYGTPGPDEYLPASPGETPPAPAEAIQGGVSENGWLQVVGTQLCNEAGEPVVLRGMSSHGLQWYGQYANAQSIQNTAAYGANVFRLAMYTGEGGCLSQPEPMKSKVIAGVEAAVENDMYVIIDWHILSDGNPMDHVSKAEAFFADMAARYADCPNVLYEICNEPNGNVSWDRDVKPYAERLVAAIRETSPQSVILIGSPTWSQDIHLAADDPVEGENLMYTLHFYAGTHGKDLRDRMDKALSAGLPLFVSEWGASRADGSGGVFLEESKVWLDFLAERGISWCNWSLCDKSETSAALKPGTSPDRAWTEEDLTESGKFVFSQF
ncbi:MAG: cellulase family glycosylhydrolase [Oscillospiraceae bacterium]|nr:cellulase family glycosylhydrolase [Oscillospiraceae bacterium]